MLFRSYGNWTVEWQDDTDGAQSNPPEYYFIATVEGESGSITSSQEDAALLEVYEDLSVVCLGTTYCSGYSTESLCESDLCEVANASVPSAITCGNGYDCGCYWDVDSTPKCNPSWDAVNTTDNESSIGTCYYYESGEDTCEGGLLTRSLIAFWGWAPGNEITQNDPLGKHLQCSDVEDTIACPALAQVSFFGLYQIVIVVGLVVLIYLIYFLRKKNHSKHVRKKRKK